jgi:hypothetical protein
MRWWFYERAARERGGSTLPSVRRGAYGVYPEEREETSEE